ncbi:unnamed protein product [marine sediment metagenome]|uniref:Uncharacterized protein n=1 Tax=marine sediment metagenome TaxID=412755 RepID=X0SG44_9ZZZZ
MGSHYATDRIPDEQIDRIAAEMGVEPDVLLEARLNVLQERMSAGRQPPMGRKRAGTKHYQFELLMPEAIHGAWKNEAGRRGLDGSALLRSMIHAYLLGSWEPSTVQKKWVWRGIGYEIAPGSWRRAHGSRYPFRERALITNAARRVLVRRGDRLGAKPTSVIRSLVLAAIEGEWAAPGTIEIVDASGMYDDEDRYFLG